MDDEKHFDLEHEFLKALAAAPKLRHIVLHDRPAEYISDTRLDTTESLGIQIFEYLQSVKAGLPLKRLDMDSWWWCEKETFLGGESGTGCTDRARRHRGTLLSLFNTRMEARETLAPSPRTEKDAEIYLPIRKSGNL